MIDHCSWDVVFVGICITRPPLDIVDLHIVDLAGNVYFDLAVSEPGLAIDCPSLATAMAARRCFRTPKLGHTVPC